MQSYFFIFFFHPHIHAKTLHLLRSDLRLSSKQCMHLVQEAAPNQRVNRKLQQLSIPHLGFLLLLQISSTITTQGGIQTDA